MRSLRVLRLAAVVTAGVLAGAAAVVTMPATSAFAARPAFQMPFHCGQVWSGATRSNHSPAQAVDLNRTDDFGDAVLASAAGTVTRVEHEGDVSYGLWIEIGHGDGWRSRYAHLSGERVSLGQHVAKGQRIGSVGNSGGSTGPHLHYEQLLNGSPVRIRFNGNEIVYYGTRNYTSRNC